MTENLKKETRPELSDVDLVRRAQMDDLSAYEQLVRRYYDRIYGFAYNMTSNREDAAKLVQDVFALAWKAVGHFSEPTGIPIWLDRIAFHRTLTFCKKRKKQNAAYFEGFDPAIKQSEAYKRLSSKGNILRKMNLKEFQRKINEALVSIPTKQRATLLLHDLHGFSSLEVAKVMNGTEGPARSRLASAHKRVVAKFGDSTINVKALFVVKGYARPDKEQVEKHIETIMHVVRSAHKKPSLQHYPDKSTGWMFAQPRYGVAALFVLFLGLHLIERPDCKVSVGIVPIKTDAFSGVELTPLSTNAPPATALPGITPFDPVK